MYFTPTVILFIATAAFAIIAMIFFFVMYKKSFRNTAMIARQTGKEVTDVIWIKDKFRVKSVDGAWVIQFWNLREKTQSIQGNLWQRFLKNDSKTLKFTKERWDSSDLSKHIQRGVYFYETTEGEFFPMQIKMDDKNPSFNVLSQDNRMFLINEFKNINNLTRNRKMELVTLGGIIAACLVLCVIFIFGIIYLNEASKRSEAAQSVDCANYARAVFNLTQGTQATYLDTIRGTVAGTPGG